MKQVNAMDAVVFTKLVTEAVECQNVKKCLETLHCLEECENFEELLAIALSEKTDCYVKVVNSVVDLVRRHTYCSFLSNAFLHISKNPRRFLKLQAVIMRIVLSWDCTLRDSEKTIDESLECDTECLSSLLPTIGPHLQQAYPSQLDKLFQTIRQKVLTETVPRHLRNKLLDLLLLRASGWKGSADNLSLLISNGPVKPLEAISASHQKDRKSVSVVSSNGNTTSSLSSPTLPELPISQMSIHEEALKEKSPIQNQDEVLLSPSAFEEKSFAATPTQVPAFTPSFKSNVTPAAAKSQLYNTGSKTAPNASAHPPPPKNWLRPEDFGQLPTKTEDRSSSERTTYTTYVPSCFDKESKSAFSSTNPHTAKSPVSSSPKPDVQNYNGARPKTTDPLPGNAPLTTPHRMSAAKTTLKNMTSQHALPPLPGSSAKKSKEESKWSANDAPARSSPNNKQKNFPPQKDACAEAKQTQSSKEKENKDTILETGVDSSEEDVIVESETKKTGKRKTKWAPLNTANVINVLPSKNSASVKPLERNRECDPSEHPFLRSQRICSICGSAEHATSTCTMSLQSCFFTE